MILAASMEFVKAHNSEIQERPSDNEELPAVSWGSIALVPMLVAQKMEEEQKACFQKHKYKVAEVALWNHLQFSDFCFFSQFDARLATAKQEEEREATVLSIQH